MIVTMLMAAALGQAATAAPVRGGPRMERGGQHMDRAARMDRFFQMADTDHNGQLSRAELQVARDRMRERRMERRANGGQWGGGKGGWGKRAQ